MIEHAAANVYQQIGFPVIVKATDKSEAGIITYPGWGAGFFVVDIDKQHGGLDEYKRLSKTIDFPKTVTARTQRGGLHLYYRYPPNVTIPWRVDTTSGIDILSDDATTHMPPSLGRLSGKRYYWIYSPQTTPMANPSTSLLTYIGAIPNE
ncbi:MAG: bifunctional DNA primase/polymerase [Bacteroidota bacterium]